MRRTFLLILLALCLVGGAALPLPVAQAQETVGSPGAYFPMPGNRKVEGNLWVTGSLYRGTAQTDWYQWLPAARSCWGDTANLTPTRVAQFDWALARTATGAETINVACNLTQPIRAAASAGYKLTGVQIGYYVGVAALTSHTWGGIRTVTYANGAANTIATWGGTITAPTLATATAANPYVATVGIGTPAFLNTSLQMLVVEWAAVLANTGVYRVYGINLAFTRAD